MVFHAIRSVSLAVLAAAAASTPTTAQGMTLGGGVGNSAALGDLNGDGRGDYLEIVFFPGTFVPHDGATGAVIPYLIRSFGSNDIYVAVGDMDGDGRDDVAYHASATGTSTVLSGADGSTLWTGSDPVLGGCDLDGDGRSDLFVRTVGATDVTTWIRSSRTGLALFSHVEPLGTSDLYALRSLGDENGDGHADALLVVSNVLTGGESAVGVIHGPDGSLTGWAVSRRLHPAGDIDVDGATDILQAPEPLSGLAPVVVRGGSHTTLWTFAIDSIAAAIGDVDGDGVADMATFALTGNRTWSGATQLQLPGATFVAIPRPLGDIDGDGRSECADNSILYQWNDPALPIASRMLRRGVPGTTSSGRKPTIVTRGHCGLGSTVWFDVRGCEPNSLVAFAIGEAATADLAPLGAPGNHSYTTLLGLQALLADGFGLAKLTAVMPTTPSLLGATASVQAATFDPAANALGLVTSNAIDLTTTN